VPLIALAAGSDPRCQEGAEADLLRLLLDSAASPNAPDGAGDTPLWWALSRPNAGMVRTLVERGAEWPWNQDASSRRIAGLIQRISDRAALREVISALGPLLAVGSSGDRSMPLWLRLVSPHADLSKEESASELLAEGFVDEASVAISMFMGRFGDTSLPEGGRLEREVRRVAGDKAWERLASSAATSLLLKELRSVHAYERELDLEFVMELLRHGALVNASQQSSRLFQREWGDEDYTPLVLLANAVGATDSAVTEAVRLLLRHRADMEKADADGDTALAWAVMKQNVPAVEALSNAGAKLAPSLVVDDGSPLAIVGHPSLLRPIAASLGPMIRTTLEGFPSPPLWLVVQFGSPQVLRALLTQEDAPTVTTADVEALLRRRTQGGGFSSGAKGGGSMEDLQVASCLRVAAISQSAGGESLEPEASARLWKSLIAEAATALLRREVEGAFEGSFVVDLGYVEALLASGADADLQVAVGEELDEEVEEEDSELADDEDDFEESEDDLLDIGAQHEADTDSDEGMELECTSEPSTRDMSREAFEVRRGRSVGIA